MDGERCFVLWNSVAQWASLIHNWAVDRGLTNTVLTLFEIHGGDDTEGEPFHTMGKSENVCIRILTMFISLVSLKRDAVFVSKSPRITS